jgi:hypothetical protein
LLQSESVFEPKVCMIMTEMLDYSPGK